jgi:hypothetical protein
MFTEMLALRREFEAMTVGTVQLHVDRRSASLALASASVIQQLVSSSTTSSTASGSGPSGNLRSMAQGWVAS